MRWNPTPAKAPDAPTEPWDTNAKVHDEWHKRIDRRGKPNTKRNLRVFSEPFFRSYESTLITTMNEEDCSRWVTSLEPKCSRLMNGAEPQCRIKLDIAACPLLTNRTLTDCPGYRPLMVSGVWPYICAVNRLYDWLLELGRVKMNPMLPVMRDYRYRHKSTFQALENLPRRRPLELQEVRDLVLRSPPHHAIAYLLAGKCFLRIHEVFLLSFEPRYCNLDEGWMIIPPVGPDEPRKREGNPDIILDAEARAWLRWYKRSWWDVHVRRDHDGKALTQNVALTHYGLPWGANAEGNFCKALHEHATRAGLMTGEETEREERVNTHCFRAFATTWARGTKVDPLDLKLLRGDKVPGAAGVYDNYRPRLPQIYANHAPVLGIRPP